MTTKSINNNEILEVIDCTPTWEGLLPMLLEVYGQQYGKRRSQYTVRPETVKALDNLKIEFRRMAQAADKWNAHVKECEEYERQINEITNLH